MTCNSVLFCTFAATMAKGIYRTTFILICLLANLLNAAAQSVTLNGLVIDNDNQQPIEFA